MYIEIDGKKIPLLDKNVKVAKNTLLNFLEISEKKSTELGSPLYKYTLYVVGYLMFSKKIQKITPDVLQVILNAVEKSEGEKPTQKETES